MGSFLIAPVQPAQPHAVPFRTILEEHRRRNPQQLMENAARVFGCEDNVAPQKIQEAIAAQEAAYEALAAADEQIQTGVRKTPLDDLVKQCADADRPLKQILHLMDASAVCLSGGGIRSASICLGVLEGLARLSRPDGSTLQPSTRGLLDQVDYLSTVSGGGYIGSWMMSWIYRRWLAAGPGAGESAWPQAYGEVIQALAGQTPVTSGDPEPQPERHLRSYTSFLAPELGLSLDSFTLAAIVLRNLVVNWTMLIPALFAVIALAETSRFLMQCAIEWSSAPELLAWLLMAAITLLYLLAASAAAAALPSHRSIDLPRVLRTWSVEIFLLGVMGASWLLTMALGNGTLMGAWSMWLPRPMAVVHRLFGPELPPLFSTAPVAFVCFLPLAVSIYLAFNTGFAARERMGKGIETRWRNRRAAVWMCLLSALVVSLLTAALISLLRTKVFPHLRAAGAALWLAPHATQDRLFIVLALPLVITVLLFTASLFCAFLGLYEREEDREWWVRCGGALLAFNLAWIAAHAIASYGQGEFHRIVAGVCGLALGLTGSMLGFSSATAAGPRPVKSAQLSKFGTFIQKHNLLLPVIGGISLALIGLGMVEAEEAARNLLAERWAQAHPVTADLRSAVAVLLAGVVLTVLTNWAININLFSLHGMYRMRLMRAFLGASNVFRRPDPFTNFDPRDTPYETELPGCGGVPLHVVNTTLNLVGTRKAAWRQRRAESFTFSPIHAGSWRLGYVPSGIYGGSRGVTLATAMSISGAAFNPNMGYQSSPVLSLLMTFFNLRLGVWLPNPKGDGINKDDQGFFSQSGPDFALRPLLAEALGLADDTSKWVELTDGGHFENLALYEMILRRVKTIVLVDAGADPKCQFEDLGNAIRKIYIDLGVPIRFSDDLKMKAGIQASNSYCAVATIDYGCSDPLLPGQQAPRPGDTSDQRFGFLIYIKAGLTGREPADILQYAKTHPTFPHENTGNQFFTESQFESYRHLGSYIIDTIAKYLPPDPLADVEVGPMDALLAAALQHWFQAGPRHSPDPASNSGSKSAPAAS